MYPVAARSGTTHNQVVLSDFEIQLKTKDIDGALSSKSLH